MEIPPKQLNNNDRFAILCELFIKKDVFFTWREKDFGRERGAGKRLLNRFTEFDFFYSLTNLHGKFNSLLGISDKYVKDLSRRYDDFVLSKQRNVKYILEDKPVVSIEETVRKPRNILEFFDN